MYRSVGDPGFLGNLFRGVTHTIGGAIGGLISGGPVGAIIGAAGGAGTAVRENIARTDITGAGTDTRGDAARLARVHAHHAAVLKHAAMAPIGGSAAGTPALPGGVMMNLGAGMGGGGGGKRRRMNPYNPRALNRANRRMSSFLHHARKFIHFYKHQEGTVKFRRPKGRRK